MFAYAGSASFPTYQQDMKNKGDFPKAVMAAMASASLFTLKTLIITFCISFYLVLICLYIPMAATGYFQLGENNIIWLLFHNFVCFVKNFHFPKKHFLTKLFQYIRPKGRAFGAVFFVVWANSLPYNILNDTCDKGIWRRMTAESCASSVTAP